MTDNDTISHRVITTYYKDEVRYKVERNTNQPRILCFCELLNDANTICDALNAQARQPEAKP